MDRRSVELALLPAALACSELATIAPAAHPAMRSWPTAAVGAALAALSFVLVAFALRRPGLRVPLAIRLLLAAIAVLSGIQVAGAGVVLADRHGNSAWLALTILGGLAVALTVAHLTLYRAPSAANA